MKYLALALTFFISCWSQLPKEAIKVNIVSGVMINTNNLKFEGICGGTELLEVTFEEINYCKMRNRLFIQGQTQDRHGEFYPYCTLVVGVNKGLGIDPLGERYYTDSLGRFSDTIKFKKNDHLYIFGVGTYVLECSLDK